MQTQFDLFKEPFLPWRSASGLGIRIGLQEAFKQAGELAPFGDAGPQTTLAVVRVLLVLMHHTRPGCNDKEWHNLWDIGSFPDVWLADIETTANRKFDLLDPERPFLQSARPDEKTRPASDLIAELPADTNINHSRHTFDDQVALCPACCGLGILRLAPFCGQGGQGKAPSINGPPPVYLLPVGDTLFRTLLLNWPLDEPVERDRPAWDERIDRRRDRIGLLEGFTWEPRSVGLIPGDARGECCTLCGRFEPQLVRRIVFQKGRDRGDQRLKGWRDPHVAYAEEASKKGAKPVRTLFAPEPVQNPRAAAGFWRELAAALLSSGHDFGQEPTSSAVARARRVRPSDDLHVLVIQTHTRQAKVLHDRLDLWTLPPQDKSRDQLLLKEVKWLSDGLQKLDRESGTGPDIAPREEFERLGEGQFRALVAQGGEGVPEWRAAVLADLRALARPVAMPGRALYHERAVRATERTISSYFPVSEERP
jgi:CRISPR type I-E-associated protein CasA/Cse1